MSEIIDSYNKVLVAYIVFAIIIISVVCWAFVQEYKYFDIEPISTEEIESDTLSVGKDTLSLIYKEN